MTISIVTTGQTPNGKAVIVKVGRIENGQPVDFEFDCRDNPIPIINITENGILYAGHTLDELREIIAREPQHP